MTGPLTLRGGADSVAVDPDRLDALAVTLTRLADVVEHRAIPALVRSSQPGPATLLDPLGSAEVLGRSAGTLTLAALVVSGCLGLAASLRTAAGAYREVDSLAERIAPLIRAVRQLPSAALDAGYGRLDAAVVDDPELADVGVQLLTGVALGAIGRGRDALRPDASAEVAGRLSSLYAGRTAALTARPDGVTLDDRGAPRSVTELLDEVAVREDDDTDGGAIDVRMLDGPGGRRVIVDIAGTTSWDLDPLSTTGQASGFGTNLGALGNRPTVIGDGVRQALRAAGVRADTPIMLVGHSQGGMVAAELATELTRDHEFTVTHVITAGSPIGLSRLPSSISVLSLENRGDPVPELDGADNPDRRHWLTVQVDHGASTVLGRHSINSYLAGATDFDTDRDSAVTDWQSGTSGYLDATAVRTEVFRIGRN